MPFSTDIHISTEELDKIKSFESLQLRMFNLPQEQLKEKMLNLSILRVSSSTSNSSQSQKSLESWNKAQSHIFSNMNSLFDFEFIKEINLILTGNQEVERNQNIFAGGASFMSNEDKDKELVHLRENILPKLSTLHPIVASTALRYWIVSLHPFKDGNGRTSQSLADALLLMNNFPPLYFKNPHQASFAFIPEYREDFTFNDALQSSFFGLGNAFRFIFEEERPA